MIKVGLFFLPFSLTWLPSKRLMKVKRRWTACHHVISRGDAPLDNF